MALVCAFLTPPPHTHNVQVWFFTQSVFENKCINKVKQEIVVKKLKLLLIWRSWQACCARTRGELRKLQSSSVDKSSAAAAGEQSCMTGGGRRSGSSDGAAQQEIVGPKLEKKSQGVQLKLNWWEMHSGGIKDLSCTWKGEVCESASGRRGMKSWSESHGRKRRTGHQGAAGEGPCDYRAII